jgi:hypothetical protein
LKLIVLLASLAGVCLPAESTNPLIGSWKLLTYTDTAEDNKPYFPMGLNPVGQLLLTTDGHISFQVMCDSKGPVPAILPPGAFDEIKNFYLGYFGTYTVDRAKPTIIFHLVGSSGPSLTNTNLSRFFRFSGDRLVITGESLRNDSHKWRTERVLVRDGH